jgi:type IV secretion system T-DNA border endonuclease VirD2
MKPRLRTTGLCARCGPWDASLAQDVGDQAERHRIARAVVSAAKSHVALGLTLRQATVAERELAGQSERKGVTDWEL